MPVFNDVHSSSTGRRAPDRNCRGSQDCMVIIDWRRRSPKTRIGPSMLRFPVGDTFDLSFLFRLFRFLTGIALVGQQSSKMRGTRFGAQKLLNRLRNQSGEPDSLVRKISPVGQRKSIANKRVLSQSRTVSAGHA